MARLGQWMGGLLLIGLLSVGLVQAQEPIDQIVAPGDYTLRVTAGGLAREIFIHIPTGYDPEGEPLPLVLALHGAGGNGENFMALTELNTVADEENFIVAYPSGHRGAWNDNRPDAQILAVDDMTFLDLFVENIQTQLNIDANRIYAGGYSMGGMMSFRLGCELRSRIAAVASVASTFPAYQLTNCVFAEPVPVLVIQGTLDPIIPFEGYGDQFNRPMMYSLADTLRYWGQHNQCEGEFTTTIMRDVDPEDGTRVRRQEYLNCADNSEVVVYVVDGGGHTWSSHPFTSARVEVGPTTMDIDASRVMWDFFSRHTLDEVLE